MPLPRNFISTWFNLRATYNAWEQHHIAKTASLTLNDEDREAWEACKEALLVSKLGSRFKALDSDNLDMDIGCCKEG